MRIFVALALAAVVVAPALAEEERLERAEYWAIFPAMSEVKDFFRAMHEAKLAPTRLAARLWQCNVAASHKLGGRKGVELLFRKIEDEAAEAMDSYAAEVAALVLDVPRNASNVEAMKAAIVRVNVKVISEVRHPPTIVWAK